MRLLLLALADREDERARRRGVVSRSVSVFGLRYLEGRRAQRRGVGLPVRVRLRVAVSGASGSACWFVDRKFLVSGRWISQNCRTWVRKFRHAASISAGPGLGAC